MYSYGTNTDAFEIFHHFHRVLNIWQNSTKYTRFSCILIWTAMDTRCIQLTDWSWTNLILHVIGNGIFFTKAFKILLALSGFSNKAAPIPKSHENGFGHPMFMSNFEWKKVFLSLGTILSNYMRFFWEIRNSFVELYDFFVGNVGIYGKTWEFSGKFRLSFEKYENSRNILNGCSLTYCRYIILNEFRHFDCVFLRSGAHLKHEFLLFRGTCSEYNISGGFADIIYRLQGFYKNTGENRPLFEMFEIRVFKRIWTLPLILRSAFIMPTSTISSV